MKRKHLLLAMAVLLAAAAFWFGRSLPPSDETTLENPSANVGLNTLPRQSQPAQMSDSPARLEPPDQSRKFRDFTPEQRVEFARKGHGPGG